MKKNIQAPSCIRRNVSCLLLWFVSASHSCQTRFNKGPAGTHHSISTMLSTGLYKGI